MSNYFTMVTKRPPCTVMDVYDAIGINVTTHLPRGYLAMVRNLCHNLLLCS